MTRPFDVAVVGAGLAGLTAARLLAERGLSVLLLDRKGSPEEAIATTGIFVRRTLEDFDLPARLLGPPIRRVTIWSPSGRRLALESPREEFRAGRMGPLYRNCLDLALAVGVVWAPRTEYVRGEAVRGGTRLHLKRSSELITADARFLAGADGALSRVARDLGLDRNTKWLVALEEVLHGVPLPGPPELHCFLDPVRAPGYLAWVALDGEETHVGVGGYPSRFDPGAALPSFRESVAARFRLGEGLVVSRRGGRIPVGGVLRRIASPPGLLLGDAAGAASPLTAGGLDPCLRLSTLAAEVIPAFLASGDPRALAPYDGTAFRRRFAARLVLRRALACLSSGPLLETAFALLTLPPGRALARSVYFGRGSFPLDPAPPVRPPGGAAALRPAPAGSPRAGA